MEQIVAIHRAEDYVLSNLVIATDVLDEQATEETGSLIYILNPDVQPMTIEEQTEKLKLAFEVGLKDVYIANQEVNDRLMFRMDSMTMNWFIDAASIDYYFNPLMAIPGTQGQWQYITNPKISAVPIILTHAIGTDEIYLGHIWLFQNRDFPDYAGLYGMKTSLATLLSGKSGHNIPDYRRGVGQKMIKRAVEWAMSSGKRKIVVPWPLEPAIPILRKAGFIERQAETAADKKLGEYLFIQPVAATTGYWVLDL